jgi:hypothetical protein
MDVNDRLRVIKSFGFSTGSPDRLSDLESALDELEYIIEHGDLDADSIAYARRLVAEAGLELLQNRIPALTKVVNRILNVAGKAAVRGVCEPHYVNGKPISSSYTLPPEYETVVAKVRARLKG